MSDVNRDANFDIASLISPKEEPEKQEISLDINSPVELVQQEEKELTPVEKMLEQKKHMGMVVENKDLIADQSKELQSPIDSEERIDEYVETMDELDDMTAKSVYLKNKYKPTSQIETSEMMYQLSTFTEKDLQDLQAKYPNGAKLKNKFFDLRAKEETDKIREEIEFRKTQAQVETDLPQPSKQNSKMQKHAMVIGRIEPEDVSKELTVEEEKKAPLSPEEEKKEEERQTLVKVLIDKTNLGIPPIFDEVEKDKILIADQVDVVEVETVDLQTVKVKKPEKSFLSMVNSYHTNGVNIPMTFPCSRFHATMSGLSYGEMSDLALDSTNMDYDKIMKRLSIIYNKMRNISSGPFATFDDFLNGFAYIDVDLATYGLYIGSSPEVDTIRLTCGNSECGKGFSVDFRPRSILLFDECSDVFLKKSKEVVDANGEVAKELFDKAPHRNEKVIKLPYSQWLLHIGYATCKEYLDRVARNDDVEKFRQTHPDDINGVKQLNIILLNMIRGISVLGEDGEYTRFDDVEDILEALYHMDMRDFNITGEIVSKYVTDYQSSFGIKNVVCPHCGTVTQILRLNVNDLVFRSYQRQVSTNINLENLEDL